MFHIIDIVKRPETGLSLVPCQDCCAVGLPAKDANVNQHAHLDHQTSKHHFRPPQIINHHLTNHLTKHLQDQQNFPRIDP